MSDKFVNAAGVQAIKSYIDGQAYTPPEIKTYDAWKYKVYDDDTFEAWYFKTGVTFNIKYASGNFYRSDPSSFPLPPALSNGTLWNVQAQVFHQNFPVFGAVSTMQSLQVQALSGANRGAVACSVVIYVFGTI